MKIRKINLKSIIILLVIGTSLVPAVFFYSKYQNCQKEKKERQELDKLAKSAEISWLIEQEYSDGIIILDINGDGYPEKVVNHAILEANDNSTLTAYNYKHEAIARTPEWFASPPNVTSMDIYRLDTNSLKEYFTLDVLVGPHQSETMFFGLQGDEMLPICKVEKLDKIEDCLFYIPEHTLIIKDLNWDGFSEVCEIVREYPSAGKKLGKEIEKTIEDVFGEDAESFKRIALVEQGELGKYVIWSIYSFNGQYFEPQLGESYDKLSTSLAEEYADLMKKSEMTEESIEYVEFARKFWTKR